MSPITRENTGINTSTTNNLLCKKWLFSDEVNLLYRMFSSEDIQQLVYTVI